MKIGVYVGSFNPVHIGHKYVMDYLFDNNYLDKIIVIPTKEYWNKTNLVDIKHRVNMLKFYENEKIIINDYLNDYEYTYEILNVLKRENPNNELYLIIGADNIEKFHLWKNVEEILKHKVIILNRDDIEIDKYVNKFKQKDNFIILKNFEKIDISSTEIRNNIDEKSKYLDYNIYKYIKSKNLYI
ncbi:MAG: nicotinate (nicotinamide) nucleotide adenylyltransferase [Bacilli bacterium]|nr:nicotinate (nicotinamide) nucleotide adenylyltransferase [Bacilli bacterium]